jgi:hypothetical protein
MSSSVLYMSMSLDGFIAGPNDEPGNPGGDGSDRLDEWRPDRGHVEGTTQPPRNGTGMRQVRDLRVG